MAEVGEASHLKFDAAGLSVSATPLLKYPWLRHASTTRKFSSPDSPKSAELYKIRELLGLPNAPIFHGQQQHTANVAIVTKADLEAAGTGISRYDSTDALVCAEPNAVVAIMTADCAPIFLVDPQSRIIALAHAGWRGTLARIAESTVAAMAKLGAAASNIVAWLGPMAGPCCYEVSEELIHSFQKEFPGHPVQNTGKHRHLDLVGINAEILAQAGLRPENVYRSDVCTIHQREQFYSYRGDQGTHGRIISAMAMLPTDYAG